MTWEETIDFIQNSEDYRDLVFHTYIEKNLKSNALRYESSDEFAEILKLIGTDQKLNIVDIGAGNGISSVALARKGHVVTSIEPDDSEIVGAGAIAKLKEEFNLSDLKIVKAYGESTGLPDASVDLVFARQAMHHAADLKKFTAEASRILKTGGKFITVRDHVIFDAEDKQRFLNEHPLHKFYGGENAFTAEEYKGAMTAAGLEVNKEIKFLENVINYSPITKEEIENIDTNYKAEIQKGMKKKVGFMAFIPPLPWLYKKIVLGKFYGARNELRFAGRMYSYVCTKTK